MPDTQTIFGNIQTVIDTAAEGITKIRQATATYQGQSPTPSSTAYPIVTEIKQLTPSQWAGIAVLGAILLLIVILVAKEFK